MYCGKCDRELPIEAFGTRKTRSGQIIPRLPCIECERIRKQESWRKRHPPKEREADPEERRTQQEIAARRARKKELKAQGKYQCTVCGQVKFLSDFPPYRATCRDCYIEAQRQRNGYYEREEVRLRMQRNRELVAKHKKAYEEKEAIRLDREARGVRFCPHCQQELLVENFSMQNGRRYQSWCKSCTGRKSNEIKKIKRKQQTEWINTCRQCRVEFQVDKEERRRQLCPTCTELGAERKKENMRKKKARQLRKRRATDGVFRLKRSISKHLREILKSKKSGSMEKWTGCTKVFLVDYITSLFETGMSWDNYGDWHIDHILPQSMFDFTDERQVKLCWNYRNLRPLWAAENVAKGDTIPDNAPALLKILEDAICLL